MAVLESVRNVSVAIGSPPMARSLFTPQDFTYLGAFRFPDSTYGARGLSVRYVNGQFRLLFGAYQVKEWTVPTLKTTGPYNQATAVKDWGDVTKGIATAGPKTLRANGILWDEIDQRLYWTYEDDYNTRNQADPDPSLGYSTLNADGSVTAYGPWKFPGRGPKMTNFGVTHLPAWFAAQYTNGKRLGIGSGGYRSILITGPASHGPATCAIDPPTAAPRAGIPWTPLVGYPAQGNPPYTTPDRCHRADLNYVDDHDHWNPRNGIGYFGWSDGGNGAAFGFPCVWIDTPTKSGLLYFTLMGNGRQYYNCSRLIVEQGHHAWVAYDPSDLGAVAQGQKLQWQIQPYGYWNWPYPGVTYPINRNVAPDPSTGCGNDKIQSVDGATFDPSTRRLYVAVRNPGYPKGCEVFVYQVAG